MKSLLKQILISVITSSTIIAATITIGMILTNDDHKSDLIISGTVIGPTSDDSWWYSKWKIEWPADEMWKLDDHWYRIRDLMGRQI